MIVEILGTDNCSKCNEVKELFEKKDIKYTYINIPSDMSVDEFQRRTGSFLVPMIFIDGKQFNYVEVLKMAVISGN